MAAQGNAPVVIKRKKVISGEGHHGGAWKVAYADFVTAMMAFFMLMWLLGATTEKQRKGIADYFNPTIPVNRVSGGGEGAFGGDSVFSENTLAQNGTGAALNRPTEEMQARGDLGLEDGETANEGEPPQPSQQLDEAQRMLLGVGGESLVSELLRRHIVTRLSDEGLIIELFDLQAEPLFDAETASPTPVLLDLLAEIEGVLGLFRNKIAVNAYTRAQPIVVRQNTGWDLSLARAGAVRTELERIGLTPSQFSRVTGHADRKPAVANEMSPRNNRVEIIMLRNRL